jgi:hypothetical protein
MPRGVFLAENARIDAFSVVADPKTKFVLIVTDLDFKCLSPCMPNRVSQRLGRNPVGLVPDDGI